MPQAGESWVGTYRIICSDSCLLLHLLPTHRTFLDHLFLPLKTESFRNKKVSGDGNRAGGFGRVIQMPSTKSLSLLIAESTDKATPRPQHPFSSGTWRLLLPGLFLFHSKGISVEGILRWRKWGFRALSPLCVQLHRRFLRIKFNLSGCTGFQVSLSIVRK